MCIYISQTYLYPGYWQQLLHPMCYTTDVIRRISPYQRRIRDWNVIQWHKVLFSSIYFSYWLNLSRSKGWYLSPGSSGRKDIAWTGCKSTSLKFWKAKCPSRHDCGGSLNTWREPTNKKREHASSKQKNTDHRALLQINSGKNSFLFFLGENILFIFLHLEKVPETRERVIRPRIQWVRIWLSVFSSVGVGSLCFNWLEISANINQNDVQHFTFSSANTFYGETGFNLYLD